MTTLGCLRLAPDRTRRYNVSDNVGSSLVSLLLKHVLTVQLQLAEFCPPRGGVGSNTMDYIALGEDHPKSYASFRGLLLTVTLVVFSVL